MGKGFVIGLELQGQSIKKCLYKAFAEKVSSLTARIPLPRRSSGVLRI